MVAEADRDAGKRRRVRWLALAGALVVAAAVVIAIVVHDRATVPLPAIEAAPVKSPSPPDAPRRATPARQSESAERTVEKVSTTRTRDGVRTTTTRTTVKTTRTVRRSRK